MTKKPIRPPSTGKVKKPGKDHVPTADDFPPPPKEQGQLHKDNLTHSPDGHFHSPK